MGLIVPEPLVPMYLVGSPACPAPLATIVIASLVIVQAFNFFRSVCARARRCMSVVRAAEVTCAFLIGIFANSVRQERCPDCHVSCGAHTCSGAASTATPPSYEGLALSCLAGAAATCAALVYCSRRFAAPVAFAAPAQAATPLVVAAPAQLAVQDAEGFVGQAATPASRRRNSAA